MEYVTADIGNIASSRLCSAIRSPNSTRWRSILCLWLSSRSREAPLPHCKAFCRVSNLDLELEWKCLTLCVTHCSHSSQIPHKPQYFQETNFLFQNSLTLECAVFLHQESFPTRFKTSPRSSPIWASSLSRKIGGGDLTKVSRIKLDNPYFIAYFIGKSPLQRRN